MANKYFIVLILLIITNQVLGQSKILNSKVGYAYNISKKASGFVLGLEYRNKLRKKHFIALGVENIFTEKRGSLPNKLISQKHILRDFSNPEPYLSPFNWSEGFPKKHLASKPDKYFNFNISTKYLYQNTSQNNLLYSFGGGFCLSYHDEMEIINWINADFNPDFPLAGIQNGWFPIFQYDTYLDLGLISQFEVQKKIKNKFSIGLSSKFYYFPKNQNTLLSLESILGIIF